MLPIWKLQRNRCRLELFDLPSQSSLRRYFDDSSRFKIIRFVDFEFAVSSATGQIEYQSWTVRRTALSWQQDYPCGPVFVLNWNAGSSSACHKGIVNSHQNAPVICSSIFLFLWETVFDQWSLIATEQLAASRSCFCSCKLGEKNLRDVDWEKQTGDANSLADCTGSSFSLQGCGSCFLTKRLNFYNLKWMLTFAQLPPFDPARRIMSGNIDDPLIASQWEALSSWRQSVGVKRWARMTMDLRRLVAEVQWLNPRCMMSRWAVRVIWWRIAF